MATGLEMYDALRKATQQLGVGSEFKVNALEARDLQKLHPSELIRRGYSEATAEKVSTALLKEDYEPLAQSMGLRLSISHDAPKLLPNANS